MNLALLAVETAEAYRPFLDPLPAWQNSRWPWLLIPLCIAVSVVYKCARCKSMKEVPRETASITVTIIVCMVAAAAVLAVIVRGLEH
jgi:hypothetical protein